MKSKSGYRMKQTGRIAGGPSFDINKSSGALGKRTGEQLKRLEESGLKNKQLDEELKRRGIKSTGISLPPV